MKLAWQIYKITNLTQIIINSSELIADKIESTEITDKEAINKNIVKLKDLRAQYLRSEKTSELIDELLNDENKPYIQKKFRVKVSNETHNDELILSRNVAIDNAKTEILYMKCRMKRWEEEINSLKDSIALSISKPDITPQQKETFKQQMSKNEDMALKERDEAVKKIRDSRENEIKSGVDQFLLIYPGSNQRGRYNWSQNFSARYRKRKCRSDQRNWRNNWNVWTNAETSWIISLRFLRWRNLVLIFYRFITWTINQRLKPDLNCFNINDLRSSLVMGIFFWVPAVFCWWHWFRLNNCGSLVILRTIWIWLRSWVTQLWNIDGSSRMISIDIFQCWTDMNECFGVECYCWELWLHWYSYFSFNM